MIEMLSRLEMTCELAGNRHLMFDESLLTSAKFAMTGPVAFSAEGSRRLKNTMVDTAWAHLDREAAIMDVALNDITRDAHRSASEHLGHTDAQNSIDALSERFSQSHDASQAYLSGEITSQTNRDVNQVLRDYQNASLRTLMTADSQGITREQAAMSVVMEEISIRRKLWFRDKLGRKIPSHKHIRRTWRMSLRDHWLMVYAQTLTAHGINEAVVWHPDPKHEHFGRKISLTEADFGLTDRDQIFHPNARALLATDQALEAA